MSFDPFSQYWERSNTSSLNAFQSLAPSKVQKNQEELPGTFLSKYVSGGFPSKDNGGNFPSKELPVALLLQQIISGLLSPEDLDPNTRDMVLIYCKEQAVARQQRMKPNKSGQDAVVPRNTFRREGLTSNVSANVNHLTNPSLSESISGISRRGMFDNGSLIPTKPEIGESAFQSFGNAPSQVLQSKSGGAFLNHQMPSGIQFHGISMPAANRQAGDSSLQAIHIGIDSSQVTPPSPRTSYLNADLTGQRTGLSMGTMFHSSSVLPTDTEVGESAFHSFNNGLSGPQYKPSSLGGSFLPSEASTGNAFNAGSFNSTKAEFGESAFRAFNNGGSSTQFLSSSSGGDILGPQGSKGKNTGVSAETIFDAGSMASDNLQNKEKNYLPFNIGGNVSQVSPLNSGGFLSKQGSAGFQAGEIPTVPDVSTRAVSGQAIAHVPSFPDPVPLNPGALARQLRASADSKRGKRRKPPVEAMVVPGNGNALDVNTTLAQTVPSEKIEIPPVVKVKEERRNKRLLRNRVSAQQARERKRQQMMDWERLLQEMEDYCSQIELKNAEFEERLVLLQEENEQLRQIVRDNIRARRQNRSKNSDDSVSQLQNELDVMNPVLFHNGGDGMKNMGLSSSSTPPFGNDGKSIELEWRSDELQRLVSLGGESQASLERFQDGPSMRGNNVNGGFY